MIGSDTNGTGTLETLTTTLIDSVNGYRDAAQNAEGTRFQELFRRNADERSRIVEELRSEITRLGGDAPDDGSFLGSTHQRFLDLKAAVTGRDDKAIINEVERGEDYLKEKFEAALNATDVAPETRTIIERACQSVCQGHDQISSLKHGLEAEPMGIFDKIKGAIFGHKDPGPGNRPTIPAGMAGGPPLQQQQQQQQPMGGQPLGHGTTQVQPAPAAAAQEVDVEQVLADISRQRGNPDLNYKSSIVDLMKLLGIDSSLENRKELAQELGYTGELNGSAEMNIWLHKATMKQLAANGGRVPASFID